MAALALMMPVSVVKAETVDYSDQVYTGPVDEEFEKENDPLYEKYANIDESDLVDATSTINWGKGLKHAASKENTKKSYGIDVSKWQGTINWSKVKDAGVEFAIIRLGYRSEAKGKLVVDPRFKENIEGAHNADIKIGVYIYTQSINTSEAKAEADFCVDTLEDYKGYLSYPIMFDIHQRIEWVEQSCQQRSVQQSVRLFVTR